jgi:TatD DNase family protein
MLFDSHAHVAAPEIFAQSGEILARAREAGVSGLIAIGAGYGIGPNGMAVALAESCPGVWAAVGLHPHDASQWDAIAEQAVGGWIAHERVVAVGECGLDYWYEHSPRDAQQTCLRAQIRIARHSALPLVIHVRPSAGTRDAFDDILRIFDEEGAEQVGGVIHCFTGDLPFAQACLERRFDISFSGILTFKNAADLREVASALPLDRLLIETDTPLLAPVPHRGKRNEPGFLVHVATCLAELHGLPVPRIAEQTQTNARRAFRLPVRETL